MARTIGEREVSVIGTTRCGPVATTWRLAGVVETALESLHRSRRHIANVGALTVIASRRASHADTA
jgi:hypothetical protein